MKKSVLKNSVILISLLILTKLSGFVKEMLVAHFYGASNITDAYNVVVSMSSILFEGFTVAICTAYISVVTKEKENEDRVCKITSSIMLLLWMVVFILSILATVFAEYVCKFFAMGFDRATMAMTVTMARVVLPIASLFVIKGILSGYLQVKGSFGYTGIGTFIMNIILIISIIFSYHNLYILAGGYVVAAVAVTIFGIVNARCWNYRFVPKIKFGDETIKNILLLAVPIFISQSITDLNLLIDRNFASVLGTGMISIFNYANKLNILFIAIFAQAFSTVIFPEFATAANGKVDKEKFHALLDDAIKIAIYVMIPIATFVCFTADGIVDLAFFRGAFTKENVIVTGDILQIYALTMPLMSAVEIYTKGYYALEDTKRPMLFSICSLTVNIIGNLGLIHLFGYRGLALATLASVFSQATLLGISYEKRYKAKKIRGIIKHIIKCIFAVMPYVVIGFVHNKIYSIDWSILLKIVVIGMEFIIAVTVYALITNWFGMRYLGQIKSILLKRNNQRRLQEK